MAEIKLKPCPFCGGKAEPFNPFENTEGTWCVICSECAAATGFEQTEAEAIEAWNTRAERTCKNNDTDNDEFFQCSECGKSSVTEFLRGGYGVPRYCPNCGARVVDE